MREDELNILFRRRIGWPEDRPIAFDELNEVLERTGRAVPFENLSIVEGRTMPPARDNLVDKILRRREGGLCYELNTLLYFFLQANGFDVRMARGIVYQAEAGAYAATGRTHVTVLLRRGGAAYVADTGFGGYLPMRLVPLSGETVASAIGEFRIRPAEGPHAELGDHMLEMKLRHKDGGWQLGYTFESRRPIGVDDCCAIQRVIVEHPESSFNKRPLVSIMTASGNRTITERSITTTANGVVTKEALDPAALRDAADYFALAYGREPSA